MSEETQTDGPSKPFDRFELATALLLGCAAIGAAVAALQSGQWGGKQLDAFAEANALTTKASTQYTEDTVLMNADYAAVAVAKQHILEARDARDSTDRERHLDLASYFYMSQLSKPGYDAMELPAGYWEEDEEEDGEAVADAGASTAAADTDDAADEAEIEAEPETEAESSEDLEPEAALEREIPDEDLMASLTVELDDDYVDTMLATGNQMFADADKRFADGRQANQNGDGYDLVGVFYTIALFFAGLGLVFKTKVRWGLLGMGLLTFAITTISMLGLPWA